MPLKPTSPLQTLFCFLLSWDLGTNPLIPRLTQHSSKCEGLPNQTSYLVGEARKARQAEVIYLPDQLPLVRAWCCLIRKTPMATPIMMMTKTSSASPTPTPPRTGPRSPPLMPPVNVYVCVCVCVRVFVVWCVYVCVCVCIMPGKCCNSSIFFYLGQVYCPSHPQSVHFLHNHFHRSQASKSNCSLPVNSIGSYK